MPIPELTQLLIPYWQEAGYQFDSNTDQSWLEQLTALIGPSLTTLKDAVEMSRLFFTESVELDEEATTQLQQENAIAIVQAIQDKITQQRDQRLDGLTIQV